MSDGDSMREGYPREATLWAAVYAAEYARASSIRYSDGRPSESVVCHHSAKREADIAVDALRERFPEDD